MEDQPNSNAEFTHSTSAREPESASPASGMFSNSQQFTVMGGTFTVTNHNHAAAPSLPSDFRMIPLGDIDLRHQIQIEERRGVVKYQPHVERACVRRVHSAKAIIAGRRSRVTVAVYQGTDAEEEWRQELAKYMSMRHPNIVQIYGAASSNGIHAMLFNDDLVPLPQFLNRYRDSSFSTIYIYACCNSDFSAAHNYIYSASGQYLFSSHCTSWIRRSTGRLCTELTSASLGDYSRLEHSLESPALLGIYNLSVDAETIATFIDLVTLEQYHRICTWNLRQRRTFNLSASTIVNPGTVFHCANNLLDDPVEIAFLPSAETLRLGNWTTLKQSTREVMPNGWTRFESGGVFNNTISILLYIYTDRGTWLSQANHIFHRLRTMSNFEDYVVMDRIRFYLNILQTTGEPPEGFLFLGPQEDFRTGPSSFCCPAHPAYWSLDPSGVDRLNQDDATLLGFPVFKFTAKAYGRSWDASVYEGLRQFHKAKGFDPYNQDVARHLGYPLFQVSSQVDAPFPYVDSDNEDFDADSDSAHTEDYESEYPPTSACDKSSTPNPLPSFASLMNGQLTDLHVDAELSHNPENVYNPVSGDDGPEHTEIANCEEQEVESIEEEMFAPSRSLNFLMSIQLGLIFSLGLSWLYDHVAISVI
ncbi:hypothetical protein C8R45DRAFT_1220424 [Mycena sanguinolenta]|nr:hypothetical protein C8R45DRAFT_1220424 [Mycena sanguinolenta]